MSSAPDVLEPDQQVEEGNTAGGPLPSSPYRPRTGGLVVVVGGLALVAASVACCLPAALLIGLSGPGAQAAPAVQQIIALAALGIGFGLALAVEGWDAWQGRPARPFQPRRVWLLWAALPLLLALGVLASRFELTTTYLLPLVSMLAMALLPFLILTTVGRLLAGRGGTGRGGTRRDVVGGLLSGAMLGSGAAMAVEIGLAALALVGAAALGLLPDNLQVLAARLQELALSSDSGALLEFITLPILLTVLFFLSIVVPLIEEATKGLGLFLSGLWLRPRPAQAFLLGVASGAGFALVENLLNSGLFGAALAEATVMRLAATVMHCTASGLVGWGWGEWRTNRRPARLALAFISAMAIHGLWNGLTIGVVATGLLAEAQTGDPLRQTLAVLVVVALGAGMVALFAAMLTGLLRGSRALARREQTDELPRLGADRQPPVGGGTGGADLAL